MALPMEDWRSRAEQCRMLAATALTAEGEEVLRAMASDYDLRAAMATRVDRPAPTFKWWHR